MNTNEVEPITEREMRALLARVDDMEAKLDGFQKLSPEELSFVRAMASLKTAGKLLVVLLAGVTVMAVAVGHMKNSLKSWLT